MTEQQLIENIIKLIESRKPYIDTYYGTVVNSLHIEYANLLDQLIVEIKQIYQQYTLSKEEEYKKQLENLSKHRCGDEYYDSPNDCPVCNQ